MKNCKKWSAIGAAFSMIGILVGCGTTHHVVTPTTNTTNSAQNVASNGTKSTIAPGTQSGVIDNSTLKSASNTTTLQPSDHSVKSQLSVSLAAQMKNVAGISDPATFVQGFKQLKMDVAEGNKTKVAAFVLYPMNISIAGKKQTIANAQAFVQNYDAIMTHQVRSAIITQQVNQLFVNAEGVMVGNGEVWLTQSGNRKCSIYAINP